MKKDGVYVVKVLIKDHHDKKNDLVSRPFVRAFNKIKSDGVNNFISNDGISLYCCLEFGKLYDIFTQRLIEVDDFDYEIIPSSDLTNAIKGLTQEEIGKIHSLIKKYIFGDDIDINFVEVSTMEELASDRAVMFKEYNNGLSLIDPYEKGRENDYKKSLQVRLRIEKEKNEKLENSQKRR